MAGINLHFQEVRNLSINPMDSKTTKALLRKVQVNIPFTMLFDDYLEPFIAYKLNPEVGIDAAAL